MVVVEQKQCREAGSSMRWINTVYRVDVNDKFKVDVPVSICLSMNSPNIAPCYETVVEITCLWDEAELIPVGGDEIPDEWSNILSDNEACLEKMIRDAIYDNTEWDI